MCSFEVNVAPAVCGRGCDGGCGIAYALEALVGDVGPEGCVPAVLTAYGVGAGDMDPLNRELLRV